MDRGILSMDGGILSNGRIYGGNATVPSISSMILPNGGNVRTISLLSLAL